MTRSRMSILLLELNENSSCQMDGVIICWQDALRIIRNHYNLTGSSEINTQTNKKTNVIFVVVVFIVE